MNGVGGGNGGYGGEVRENVIGDWSACISCRLVTRVAEGVLVGESASIEKSALFFSFGDDSSAKLKTKF